MYLPLKLMASLSWLRSVCCDESKGTSWAITRTSRAHKQLNRNDITMTVFNIYYMEDKEQKIEGKVAPLAFKKIVYHLLRYPDQKVYGALVGNANEALDAYPLTHSPLLNPTLSVALDLIQSNLSNQSYQIIGFYESAEGGHLKMGTLIENNSNLKNSMAVRAWMNEDNGISLGAASYNLSYPPFSSLEEELRNGEYRFIVDFDAHFQEIQLDFTNSHLK